MADTENQNKTTAEAAPLHVEDAPVEAAAPQAPAEAVTAPDPAAAEAAPAAAEAAPAVAESEAASDGDGGEESKSSAPELPDDEMSFAEMFELAEKQSRAKKSTDKAKGALRPGRIVEATVVAFSHDSAFVDLGGKAEGVVPKDDLLGEDGELAVKEGDKVELRVVSTEGGQIRLGRALGADSAKNRETVQQAHENGMTIEGRVTGQNKGGLDVEVGGLRAFCPISQVDVRFCPDPGQFVGQKIAVKVVEFKDRGRNVVVSRRAVLEEQNATKKAELLGKLAVGQVLIGEVTTVKDYGAFVDVGGIEGLVHVSEITHGRINKPSEKLSVGMQMDVQIKKIEEGKNGEPKISLSMKALEKDPWDEAKAALREGQKITGKVQRIQPFGAFVEVMPGVDGLIHVSNMSNERISNPNEILKVGQEVEATIVTLDWNKQRVGLSLVKSRQELAGELASGAVYEGTVDRVESFGLFVKLPTGARGLVPLPETGTARGTDLSKEFAQGATVKVTVLDVEKKTGKIRLSIKRAVEAEERALYANYMTDASGGGKKGLGTFADLFAGKFGK